MANFEYDSNSDSEWDDSWETIWNEHDWELYLKNEKNEVRRYQKCYNKLTRSPNRLDEVALYMGWDVQNEANNKESEPSDSPSEPIQDQPYTLHKHPLFIASKALHDWLTEKWSQHVSLCSDQLSPTLALEAQNVISESDHYGLLAVTALDLGDYSLAIAYFKRGQSALNRMLSILSKIESMDIAALNAYAKHAKIRVFDIREIWLRVSADCRTAASKRLEEE